jgi:hypothetical protein
MEKIVSTGTTTVGKAKKNGKVKKATKSRKALTCKGAPNKLIGRVLNTMEKHREVLILFIRGAIPAIYVYRQTFAKGL